MAVAERRGILAPTLLTMTDGKREDGPTRMYVVNEIEPVECVAGSRESGRMVAVLTSERGDRKAVDSAPTII